ncbi:IS66 family transposase [Candidatus Poribacteria bacterium]
MNKIITSEILVSYSQCPRKAYLLLCTNQRGTPHEYMRILQQRKEVLQRKHIKELKQKNTDVQSYSTDNLKNRSSFLINAELKADGFEAECGILTKVVGSSALGRYSYEPTLFIGTHKIDKYQKLALFFVGYVLEQIQSKQPTVGRIAGVDGRSHRVKLENSSKTLVPLLEPLQEWTQTSSPDPPALILNKYCIYCQFQNMCKDQAEQEDNLSLLDAISTPKAVRRYEKKGIFTVKQLSYLFKPRKRKKRTSKSPLTHKPELQALAIRTGKIYIQELPELSRQSVELFLDIEGVPDQQFYYLIGLLVCNEDMSIYYSFWADSPQEEAQIWRQFLERVGQYPKTPIYHYGSYEPRAIKKLARRYESGVEDINDRLVNVNSHIYGKVYFPVRSNRLKELGRFTGASWTSPDASGLHSLVWRYYWDTTRDTEYRCCLVTYNMEDCQALKILADELSRIGDSANALPEIDFADQPKSYATEIGQGLHDQFETILEFAHADYDRKKISFRTDKVSEGSRRRKTNYREGFQGQRRVRPKPTKVVHVEPRMRCPIHNRMLRKTDLKSERLIIDLILTRNGVRKAITHYTGHRRYCSKCHRPFSPPKMSEFERAQLYGHGFRAWIVYQRVALRTPYNGIVEFVKEQFNEDIVGKTVQKFIKNFGVYYAETEKQIIQNLLEAPVIHVDETPINIGGSNQYVWVFTNGEYVAFRLTETRETSIVMDLLEDYDGILVSDFYPGYDSIGCRQQKCWVHLIRDLNDALWNSPYDTEFEVFILEVRNLIIPIMQDVEKYGLKKWNLNKHNKKVDEFYRKMITEKRYKSDLACKYQQRFVRYRSSLFTFLQQDEVPWHNNAAERGLRHIAKQQQISMVFGESVTRGYLVLLGIRQTCRFQGKSFFRFLFSGEKDIDQFMGPRRNKNRR